MLVLAFKEWQITLDLSPAAQCYVAGDAADLVQYKTYQLSLYRTQLTQVNLRDKAGVKTKDKAAIVAVI